MSAFQLQEWWSTQVGNTAEEFDYGCFAIGNIDNVNPPSDKIAIGSQQGMLRIYNPAHPIFRMEDLMVEENLNEPILQLLVGLFIPSTDALGLAVLLPRKLVVFELLVNQGRDGRVNYYSLQKLYEHNLGIEGKHFTAYNMISGTFGGTRGREVIVVQSLDGKLQIFEQSASAFTRQLVDCLMPGPIWYWPRTDSVITTNDDNNIECYKYQVLASSQGEVIGPRSERSDRLEEKSQGKSSSSSSSTTGMFQLTAVRSALVEWSILLGEPSRQIVDGHFSSLESLSKPNNSTIPNNELLVLTDHSLFLVKESGNILQQRRLESDPSCLCSYRMGSAGHSFILASHDKTIHIYREFNLVWAAKISTVPVQIQVGNFGNMNGLIVTVDETGYLSISYLGTKPPITAVVGNNITREVDYDKIDEEHRSLLQIIRESQNDQKQEPREKLTLRLQTTKLLDTDNISGIETKVDFPKNIALLRSMNDVTSNDGSRNVVKVAVKMYVSYVGIQAINNVSIGVSAPDFIYVLPNNHVIQSMKSSKSTPLMIKFYMICSKECLPYSLQASFSASYTCSTGEPRITSLPFHIPLHVICQPRPPSKNALYKVTIDTVMSALALTDLFDDFLYAIQESNVVNIRDVLGNVGAQAMGFQFYTTHYVDVSKLVIYINSKGSISNDPHDENIASNKIKSDDKIFPVSNFPNTDQSTPSLVSILVSKNAGRYRIQSDSLAAIYMIASELERRILIKSSNLSNTSSTLEEKTSLSSSTTIHSNQSITCGDNLYLDEFFAIIELHFQIRVQLINLLSQLNDRAHQFRMIQKRLLVRYKDRNPTPLAGTDILMRESYDSLLKLSDAVEENQIRLKHVFRDLINIAKLIVFVAGVKYGLPQTDRDILQSSFCPELREGMEQGWEETVDANLMYLLKTTLAKNVRESASMNNTALEMPVTTDALKKHITIVFDRISKGARLSTTIIPSSDNMGSTNLNHASRK